MDSVLNHTPNARILDDAFRFADGLRPLKADTLLSRIGPGRISAAVALLALAGRLTADSRPVLECRPYVPQGLSPLLRHSSASMCCGHCEYAFAPVFIRFDERIEKDGSS
jgi:hypothetical protein